MSIKSNFEEDPKFEPMIKWWEIVSILLLVAFFFYVGITILGTENVFKYFCYSVLVGLGIFSIIWFVKHNIFEK